MKFVQARNCWWYTDLTDGKLQRDSWSSFCCNRFVTDLTEVQLNSIQPSRWWYSLVWKHILLEQIDLGKFVWWIQLAWKVNSIRAIIDYCMKAWAVWGNYFDWIQLVTRIRDIDINEMCSSEKLLKPHRSNGRKAAVRQLIHFLLQQTAHGSPVNSIQENRWWHYLVRKHVLSLHLHLHGLLSLFACLTCG